MGKVVFNTSVSLDGFVAGPNDGPENGLGDGGERLYDWIFNGNIEIALAEGHMAMKVSPQSAALLQADGIDAISLDGYGAGPNQSRDNPLGGGGVP